MKRIVCITSVFLLLFCLLWGCEQAPDTDGTGAKEDITAKGGAEDALCAHSFGAWETLRAPDCTTAGKRTCACRLCGVRANEPVTDGMGHLPCEMAAVSPTCLLTGSEGGVACSRCGEVLSPPRVLARRSHAYVAGVCTVCGREKPSEGLLFARNSEGYTLTGMGACRDERVVIPDTYLGLPVTEIGREALAFLSFEPSELVIPDSVTRVASYALDVKRHLTLYTGKNAYFEPHALFFGGSGEVVNQTGEPLAADVFLGHTENLLVHTMGATQRTVTAEGFVFLTVGTRTLLCDYIGTATEVVLPAFFRGGKYYVAPYALYGKTGVTSLAIGEGVLGIGEFAFAKSGWERLDLLGVYDTLPLGAFMECYGLSDVTVPSNVRVIEPQCFFGVRLASVILGASVESIGHAFALSVATAVYRNPNTPRIPLQ